MLWFDVCLRSEARGKIITLIFLKKDNVNKPAGDWPAAAMLGKSASQGDFSLDINSADEPSHMFAVRARRCFNSENKQRPNFS